MVRAGTEDKGRAYTDGMRDSDPSVANKSASPAVANVNTSVAQRLRGRPSAGLGARRPGGGESRLPSADAYVCIGFRLVTGNPSC